MDLSWEVGFVKRGGESCLGMPEGFSAEGGCPGAIGLHLRPVPAIPPASPSPSSPCLQHAQQLKITRNLNSQSRWLTNSGVPLFDTHPPFFATSSLACCLAATVLQTPCAWPLEKLPPGCQEGWGGHWTQTCLLSATTGRVTLGTSILSLGLSFSRRTDMGLLEGPVLEVHDPVQPLPRTLRHSLLFSFNRGCCLRDGKQLAQASQQGGPGPDLKSGLPDSTARALPPPLRPPVILRAASRRRTATTAPRVLVSPARHSLPDHLVPPLGEVFPDCTT